MGQAFCYFAALGSGAVAFEAIWFFVSPPPPCAPGGANGRQAGESPLVQIFVRDNNVDQALKALKKKMQREGSFREMKRHVHYEKPSEKRARQKAEAVRRARKLARKRAQREGLIAAPKRPSR
jgi:small subunit ribosomal protein S21|tara:strand:- start:13983 stop:14351 length:369 start_codon:yes stop_codon:yes gene_type:complete